MIQKRGNGSAGEAGVGSAVAVLIVWVLSFTPYKMDATTAASLVAVCAVLSSKLIGDRRK